MKFNLIPFKKTNFFKNFNKNYLFKNQFQQKYTVRTFFGFLKPKPFIRDSIFFFLQIFTINPKPYTFSRFISFSKKYKPKTIQLFITKRLEDSNRYWSSILLNKLIKKLRLKYITTQRFLLFKHRIFQYTTPKQTKLLESCPIKPEIIDFRTNLHFNQIKPKVPNITTLSTYN